MTSKNSLNGELLFHFGEQSAPVRALEVRAIAQVIPVILSSHRYPYGDHG
jgi:hypothetical protein